MCITVTFYYKGRVVAVVPDKLFLALCFDGEDDLLEKESDVFSIPAEGGKYLGRVVNFIFSRIDVKLEELPFQRLFAKEVLLSPAMFSKVTSLISAYYALVQSWAEKARLLVQSGNSDKLWYHVPQSIYIGLSFRKYNSCTF